MILADYYYQFSFVWRVPILRVVLGEEEKIVVLENGKSFFFRKTRINRLQAIKGSCKSLLLSVYKEHGSALTTYL